MGENDLPMQDEDITPMLAKGEPQDNESRRDNSRDPKFCICFTMKCGINFVGILLTLHLILSCVQAALIDQNAYFEEYFYLVFILCLLPITVAFTLYLMYWVGCDNMQHRKRLPLALILSALTAILLFTWIMVYILAIYDKEDVYIGHGEKADKEEEE